MYSNLISQFKANFKDKENICNLYTDFKSFVFRPFLIEDTCYIIGHYVCQFIATHPPDLTTPNQRYLGFSMVLFRTICFYWPICYITGILCPSVCHKCHSAALLGMLGTRLIWPPSMSYFWSNSKAFWEICLLLPPKKIHRRLLE